MLELKDNNLKQSRQELTKSCRIIAIENKCTSWMCEKCRVARGLNFKARLIEKAELFKMAKLYTITINREWHESPLAAYRYVSSNSLIPRLFKLLEIKNWVWALEVQEETGEGWPHWHIMIDVSALPGLWYNKEYKATVLEKPDRLKGWIYVPHYLDLNRVHYLLRKWEIGEQCRFSVKKENFKSIEHAINYISKYLIKMPKKGFPEWMLNTPNIRFMGASKSLGTLISKEAKETKAIDSANRKNRKIRKPFERISECRKSIIFKKYDSQIDGYEIISGGNATMKDLIDFDKTVIVNSRNPKNNSLFKQYGLSNQNDLKEFLDKVNPPNNDYIENCFEKLEPIILFNEKIGEHIKVSPDRSTSYVESGVKYSSDEIPALMKLKDSSSLKFIIEIKKIFNGKLII